MLKNARPLGCVFQDMEPPKYSSILRKSSTISKPVRCVQFTKAVLHFANIRDTKLSLGVICPGDPHQRNPNAQKIEDRSQEETERQERYAREAAWKMARSILELKEKYKAAFFSLSENWCLPSPSTNKPKSNNDKSAVAILKKENWQERESVSDSCHDRSGQPGKKRDHELNENLLNVDYLMHDNWVVYVKT